MKNLINLAQEDLSKPIYRIIPLNYLVMMLENQTNALAKTSSWDDPYENFFFKEKFSYQGKPVTLEHLGLIIFGQCWSLFRDSDALWRIYSMEKQSVRISTTIEKLYDSVYIDDSCMAITHIGSVEYKSKKDINEWIKLKTPITMSSIQRTSVDSLFIKRNNFSHEKEVRVIYQPDSHSAEKSNSLKIYPVDPIDFIDEITFDPRVDDAFYQSALSEIIKYKYPLSRVKKSPLYDFKPTSIKIE